jgi:hypothetical protein
LSITVLRECMLIKTLGSTLLVVTLQSVAVFPTVAETPPAQTYQPGFWQPVARFNPKQKVTLKLVNQSGVVLNYDNTDSEFSDPKDLGIDKTDALSDFGNSAYFMIYPATVIDPDQPFNLKFSAQVDEANNLVTVTITKGDRGFMGNRTVNLQKTGAVYFY